MTGLIVEGMAFEDYLAAEATSKSQLWTLHTRSPAHARVEKEQSNAMAMGVAVHCAVLEPDCFEERFVRGPDDRRGNKWKDAHALYGDKLLTSGDYDDALAIRDALMSDALIRSLTRSAETVREVSAFADCPETGLRVRCRPDAWAPSMGMLLDLKSTTDARAEQFARRVESFGYHAQEAHYTDTWQCAMDDVDAVRAFVFLVVETKPPYAFALYELEPSAVIEGRMAMHAAKQRCLECQQTGIWPGYPQTIQMLDLRRWAYKLSEPTT